MCQVSGVAWLENVVADVCRDFHGSHRGQPLDHCWMIRGLPLTGWRHEVRGFPLPWWRHRPGLGCPRAGWRNCRGLQWFPSVDKRLTCALSRRPVGLWNSEEELRDLVLPAPAERRSTTHRHRQPNWQIDGQTRLRLQVTWLFLNYYNILSLLTLSNKYFYRSDVAWKWLNKSDDRLTY